MLFLFSLCFALGFSLSGFSADPKKANTIVPYFVKKGTSIQTEEDTKALRIFVSKDGEIPESYWQGDAAKYFIAKIPTGDGVYGTSYSYILDSSVALPEFLEIPIKAITNDDNPFVVLESSYFTEDVSPPHIQWSGGLRIKKGETKKIKVYLPKKTIKGMFKDFSAGFSPQKEKDKFSLLVKGKLSAPTIDKQITPKRYNFLELPIVGDDSFGSSDFVKEGKNYVYRGKKGSSYTTESLILKEDNSFELRVKDLSFYTNDQNRFRLSFGNFLFEGKIEIPKEILLTLAPIVEPKPVAKPVDIYHSEAKCHIKIPVPVTVDFNEVELVDPPIGKTNIEVARSIYFNFSPLSAFISDKSLFFSNGMFKNYTDIPEKYFLNSDQLLIGFQEWVKSSDDPDSKPNIVYESKEKILKKNETCEIVEKVLSKEFFHKKQISQLNAIKTFACWPEKMSKYDKRYSSVLSVRSFSFALFIGKPKDILKSAEYGLLKEILNNFKCD